MAVKHVQSAARVLLTFEALAEHQPIGVGALARVLDEDKSAVQRALMTLADVGWIQRVAGDPQRWEAASRIRSLAPGLQRRNDVRDRAHPVLEALRDATEETVLLAIPANGTVVVIDVVESHRMVRTAPAVGFVVPPATSAAGQAILARLPDDELATYLDIPIDDALRDRLSTVRDRGWAVNDHDVTPGVSAVAAAVLDAWDRPLASIAVSGPADRLPPAALEQLGAQTAAAATQLS